MSNWKRAYGWSGHILVSAAEMVSNPDDNMVAIPAHIMRGIIDEQSAGTIDSRFRVETLGIENCDNDAVELLAVGVGFSEAFTHYGTVFIEAELRVEKHPLIVDLDKEYLAAMKELYGLDLPPCRLMIGCSSEHI